MEKLTIESKILVGAESKQWLADLAKQLDRMEALTKKGTTTQTAASTIDAEESDDEDFEEKEKPAKKTAAKAAASFDDEDDATNDDEITEGDDGAPTVTKKASGKKAAASFDDEVEEDEAPAPAKKATKAKKITIDEVNDACKARVTREIETRGCTGKEARQKVLGILTKKFKTTSVSELKPEQYAEAVAAMQATK